MTLAPPDVKIPGSPHYDPTVIPLSLGVGGRGAPTSEFLAKDHSPAGCVARSCQLSNDYILDILNFPVSPPPSFPALPDANAKLQGILFEK